MHTLTNESGAEPLAVPPAACGAGDAEFGALYEEHSKAVYYLALRLMSDPAKAEDVVHDVFLKAFRKLHCFRGGASWRTWLYRITINHCLNLRRAWHSRNIFSNADEVVFDNAVAPTDSPLRILETKELGERIQATLDMLPEEQRLLLLLVADQELSYEEIGVLTEQSADAVRGKLHRARRAFARHFQHSNDDGGYSGPARSRRLSTPAVNTSLTTITP